VVTRVVEEASGGPRWLVLGTGSKSAASIYASRGFRGLSGAFEGGARGYNPDDLGEWMMVRDSAEPSAVDIGSPEGSTNIPFDVDAYVVEPGAVAIETLGRRHMGAAVLLLNIVAGTNKLRAFGINEGLEAEQRLAKALSDGDAVTVAVHRDTRRIYGIAVRDASSGLELYTIGPPSVGAALATGAPCVSAAAAVGPSLESECREFWERGYRVFPGLLADVAASARASMDEMMKAGGAKPTSDWNAVNSGGAEFVLQVDEQGSDICGHRWRGCTASWARKSLITSMCLEPSSSRCGLAGRPSLGTKTATTLGQPRPRSSHAACTWRTQIVRMGASASSRARTREAYSRTVRVLASGRRVSGSRPMRVLLSTSPCRLVRSCCSMPCCCMQRTGTLTPRARGIRCSATSCPRL